MATDEELQAACEDGWTDALVLNHDNPHPPGSDLFEAYERGYRAGREYRITMEGEGLTPPERGPCC